MHGLIVLAYGDNDYSFRLTLDGLAEIEEKFDRSIFVIANGLRTREAKTAEIREVIRVGLIGGGMAPVDALALVRRYLDQRPIDESRDVALAVALAGLARVHSVELAEPPGELQAPATSNE